MIKKFEEFLLISLGTALVAIGVYFFKFPNNFTTGGVSGLSIIFGSIIKTIQPGTFILVINSLFLILGFIFLDKGFGIKTIYCSILFSVLIKAFEIFIPFSHPFTDQKLLELIYSVIFPAIGSALLFNTDASTGGTEIIAMIMKKYSRLDIGKALLCTDFIIAFSSLFLFGIETGMYSILGLVLTSFLVDSVIENINLKKSFTIITNKPKEICTFINDELHRGATVWPAKGAFTEEQKWVILTALNRVQANVLRRFVKNLDPNGFMVISNTSGIIGRGFREV